MIVSSDTSPITALRAIQKINLLHQLYGEIKIPPAVSKELQTYHNALPDFNQTDSVGESPLLRQLYQQLDPGEAEAIILAKELHADFLLIDASLGREAARHEHLPVIGLMGALLIAKKKRLIPSVRDLSEQLETYAGFYLSRQVKEQVVAAAGE